MEANEERFHVVPPAAPAGAALIVLGMRFERVGSKKDLGRELWRTSLVHACRLELVHPFQDETPDEFRQRVVSIVLYSGKKESFAAAMVVPEGLSWSIETAELVAAAMGRVFTRTDRRQVEELAKAAVLEMLDDGLIDSSVAP
jgi:hypothetical protein